jgi:RNA polymerase sigma-70 factor (ECF subfamily)
MASDDGSCLMVDAVPVDALSQSCDLHQRVAELYETHRNGIYRFLVGQGLNPAVAQEVTQDVFVDLFLALQKGTSLQSEQRWLYVVAGRAAVDYWRHERGAVWVELDLQSAANAFCSREPTPEIQAAKKEQWVCIAGTLSRLPKEQRLAVQLRIKGLRYREIAAILNVSKSTAADWVSTAVERLRGDLND